MLVLRLEPFFLEDSIYRISTCNTIIEMAAIRHFGKRLSFLLNQRLTRIYQLNSKLLATENELFSQIFFSLMNGLIEECAAMPILEPLCHLRWLWMTTSLSLYCVFGEEFPAISSP